MAHKHSIYDCDTHFSIDLKTREIKNDIGKTVIVQNDHNSERFSFELPKEIEGHDMSLCNVVQVHFVNTDSQTKEKHSGLYTVDDLQISPDGDDVVILSWLLSQEATRAVGSLYFGIVFKCIEEDGTLTYSWHTTVNKDFKVVESLDNSNVIIEEYPDVLAQLEARLAAVEQGGGSGGSGSGLTEEQAADLAANTEARHAHSNKTNVLDKFTLDDKGSLLFDGKPIEAEGVGKTIEPRATTAQTVISLLEGSTTNVSFETPDDASTEGSDFALRLYDLIMGYVLLYAPAKDGTLTYTDPVSYEIITFPVYTGSIYEFYIDFDLYETKVNSYAGVGVLEFFKSKLLTDGVPEADSVPSDKVSYSNSILDDKSGTIKGALDEVVSFAVTTIPDLEANKHTHKNKELLDNAENIFAKKADLEGIGAVTDNIPDYWKPALEEGAEAINTALMTAGYNKSAFLFYSDTHWNYGSKMSPKLLKYLYQHTGMTKTNFGGDIVNDEATDYDGMEYLWDWRNQLKELPNHHSVVGNHDDGNSTNNLFSEQYVYGYLLAAEETPEVVRGGEGMYYYIDHSPEKTRYLYLDTAYKGVTDKQQAFIKEALLSTPEGWHIVAISHIWHNTIYNGANREVGELSANALILLAMFDNYNSRVGDYADCGGWVEFCIGGHTHLDHDSTSSTGIPIILVATDSQHTGGGASFTYGTDTEASVNGIIADYDNHKIYVVRIGRGESRTIDVTNYVVTYTNVLPTSIDTDGSVYNGVGYKANVRWSTSSNAETTYEGAYLSGYISAPAGSIVRLKNITMSKTDTTGRLCNIYFCIELGNMGNQLIGSEGTLDTYASPVWDDSGNLVQFTSTAETKYIRLQTAYIGPDSVITINEPLE